MMTQLLIIPDVDNMDKCRELAKRYNLGYEFNDFYSSSILDDQIKSQDVIKMYMGSSLPSYCTLHGAFIDVIPFSKDEKIRSVSVARIRQSLDVARVLGAKAVVFHTNYNPFLNSREYINQWIDENSRFWANMLDEYSDINIYLENMFDVSPDIMGELSSRLCVHTNYGVCLDYAHAALSKVSPEEWCKKLGKYIKHVHINDNDLHSDLHLAWGDGQINRNTFYNCYKKYMNDATVLIETASMDNIKRSLEVLKTDGFLL